MLAALGDHFDRTERTLVELVNADDSGDGGHLRRAGVGARSARCQPPLSPVGARHGVARARRSCSASSSRAARHRNSPSQLTADEFQALRARIEARSLVFKVRVTGADVRARQRALIHSGEKTVMIAVSSRPCSSARTGADRVPTLRRRIGGRRPSSRRSRRSTSRAPRRSIGATGTPPPRPSAKSARAQGRARRRRALLEAYAHNKRGRRDDALQAIAALKSGYPAEPVAARRAARSKSRSGRPAGRRRSARAQTATTT